MCAETDPKSLTMHVMSIYNQEETLLLINVDHIQSRCSAQFHVVF